MRTDENLQVAIYDLESQLRQKEDEIIKIKVEMSEEIQRLKSELHAMQILFKEKAEEIGRSNRRPKRRIYFP
jgi:uncharacterized protein YicC (UPF0701 family)